MATNNTAKKPILPSDCAILSALPLDRQSFLETEAAGHSDLIRTYAALFPGLTPEALWTTVFARPMGVVRSVLDEAEQMGVLVSRTIRLEGLSRIFFDYRVVTMLSHSTGTHIELSDGMCNNETLAECVPATFAGTIDLTVCNAYNLSDHLKKRNRSMTVISNRSETSLVFRLSLYRMILRTLRKGSRSYAEAVEEIRTTLGKEIHQK